MITFKSSNEDKKPVFRGLIVRSSNYKFLLHITKCLHMPTPFLSQGDKLMEIPAKSECVKVVVRCRPMSSKETKEGFER